MNRLLSAFPTGLPGVGLLGLRLILGLYLASRAMRGADLAPQSGAAMAAVFVSLGLLLLAAMLIAGFQSPLVQGLIAVSFVVLSVWEAMPSETVVSRWETAFAIATAVGLALTGPGAYSVDSYVFGPREISIPPRRTSRDKTGRK